LSWNKEGGVKRNEGVLVAYAFMVPLLAAERAVIEEALYKEGGNPNTVVQCTGGTILGAKPFLTQSDIHTLEYG
jgi:hypothetical protein